MKIIEGVYSIGNRDRPGTQNRIFGQENHSKDGIKASWTRLDHFFKAFSNPKPTFLIYVQCITSKQCEEETTSFVEDLFNREGELGREPRLNNFYALQNKTRANYFSFLIDWWKGPLVSSTWKKKSSRHGKNRSIWGNENLHRTQKKPKTWIFK